jgi:rRNA maturation endonuclease Nob1
MMSSCAKCGTKLPDAANFCPRCGAATHEGAGDLAGSIIGALETAGKEIEVAFKTAGDEVANALTEANVDLSRRHGSFCPKCGQRNPPASRFCLSCGRQLPGES